MVFQVNDKIKRFADVYKKNGHSLYIVGGAVRDYLLGIENTDYDFCSDATAEETVAMFRHVIPTGIKHGTVTVIFEKEHFEVTTFRTEGSYTDSRHPDNVSFVRNLNEDLSRRDFTINAFACDPNTGEITDLFGGMADLKNKILRTIGDPSKRFTEDALRLMRFCRFCSKLDFKPDPISLESAKKLSLTIKKISKERIFDELFKILKSKKPSVGLRLMEETGLMEHVLPEVHALKNIPCRKKVCSDYFEHTMLAVDAAAEYENPSLSLALLLHDIGKSTSDNHCITGSDMAGAILKRLKCSNELISFVKNHILNHMIIYTPDWKDSDVKRFIINIGKENISTLFELQFCDQIASEGVSKEKSYKEFTERIKTVSSDPMYLKDLAVNGKDLLDYNIKDGREIGKCLNYLLEEVLEKPELNTKEKLLELLNNSKFQTGN